MSNINEKMREQVETMNNSIMHNHVWNLWNVLHEIQNIDEHAKVQVVTGFFPIFTTKPAMPKTILKRLNTVDEKTRINGVQMQNGVIYVVA